MKRYSEEEFNAAIQDAYLRGAQAMRDRAVDACDELAATVISIMGHTEIYREIITKCSITVGELPLIPLDTAAPLDKETEK